MSKYIWTWLYMQLCSSFVLSFKAASKLTISGINLLLLLATQLAKQKYRLHPKYTHAPPSNIYTCMHITFGCYYHTAPTQGVYVYWMSGQRLWVLSPITAARAEQDSVNANLGNSRREGAVFWLFLLLSARKMSTDFKMSFVDAGKIKRTCIP